jgi:hypothetical protein
MAKPSTQMLHREVQKFMEPLKCKFDHKRLLEAMEATLHLESDGRHPCLEPTFTDFHRTVVEMDNDRTNAGSDSFGDSHHDYILEMGDGNEEDGCRKVASDTFHLYQCITGRVDPTAEDREALELMRVWCVQGKRDGYKYKKLFVGRSIQAPSMRFKVLYRTIMKAADTTWISRKFMMRAGYDMDRAVDKRLVELYVETLASLGLDETGFDRLMPREFMQAYFRYYLPFMCPGVDSKYLNFLEDCTIDALLLMTDGAIYEKERGNPSGFPNTLRLNCVVQLLAWCYAMSIRLEELGKPNSPKDVAAAFMSDVFLEICGDDSRANVLTETGMELLDARNPDEPWGAWLKIWRERLPWDVKIEGQVVFDYVWVETVAGPVAQFAQPIAARMARMPPLVARNLFVVDDMLWSPLWNAGRCVRKLMSEGTDKATYPLGRSEADEKELRISAFISLKLVVWWHQRHIVFSPTVQCMLDNGWYEDDVKVHVNRALADVWYAACAEAPRMSWYE